ncbi:MAG: hypothetical protein K0R63_1181 [Rickettsiales bacterium]|jgi:hypothetical protein|nr:hypothetical protein [Rickettsiales bacterium]
MMDCKEQSNQTSKTDVAELPWAAANWWFEQLINAPSLSSEEAKEEVESSPEAFAFAPPPPPLPRMEYTPAPSAFNWWETAPGFDAFAWLTKPKPQAPACPFTQSALALNDIWGNYFKALTGTATALAPRTMCGMTSLQFPLWKL